MPEPNSKTVLVAVIGALALIISALVPALMSRRQEHADAPAAQRSLYRISGTVLDAKDNTSISNAGISVVGHTSFAHSDNNGYFSLELLLDQPKAVNIRVEKKGYAQYEQSVTPPVESLPVLLRRSAGN